MDKEKKEIEEMYDKLSEKNKEMLNMITRAMTVAEENIKKGERK